MPLMISLRAMCLLMLLVGLTPTVKAQTLEFVTVERPPFAMGIDDHTGFSIDLMNALATQLNIEVRFETAPSFSEMLRRVESGEADGAIANISITAAREEVMDFTLPIFDSGLQLMVHGDDQPAMWRQFVTPQIGGYLATALALLFVAGMLMWVFERRAQPYFDRPPKQALFPSFWWALNLVVNGGFEERMPRSFLGRILSVILVFSSLFIVSIFVAGITSAMTVTALRESVTGLNDLDTRDVGSVLGSTASNFLDARQVDHIGYEDYADMITAFESGDIDVVVFDGPLLRYYLLQNPDQDAYLVENVFRNENYGIALPTGSELREPLNQAILTMSENGSYNELMRSWFGSR